MPRNIGIVAGGDFLVTLHTAECERAPMGKPLSPGIQRSYAVLNLLTTF
jgi:hypothetical protein